ncbi:hypothetical protein B1L04_02870 [Microcystis aeruginosa KW]|uniref:Uncharacterized protein n=1 Tax=Microcystis aeruginosa KW TaxID=1960155 RepID=A0A1V4BYK6_MICAE|nr:hypothetical protein [Microcystis aeruginosa]OPF19743.1 hypothetical protein B1L04_02870 [Microcystis aeruginosa KW]
MKISDYPLLLATTGLLFFGEGSLHRSLASPTLTDSHNFRVELYADLSAFGRLKAFSLNLTSGESGFPAGLYVATGPYPDDRSNRLLYINPSGQIIVVKDGLTSNFSSVFAKGNYGNGIFIAEPETGKVLRLLPDGTITTFMNLNTPQFGPATLAYGPDGFLFATVTDPTEGRIIRIHPDGNNETFAHIPLAKNFIGIESLSALTFNPSTGGFITGIFAFDFSNQSIPSNNNVIFSVSADGGTVTPLIQGQEELELFTFGPGGAFGRDLFVAQLGKNPRPDRGSVYTLLEVKPNQFELTEFMANIDATSVVFDTQSVLGGGMFVTDFVQPINSPGKVWRVFSVSQVSEPSSPLGIVLGVGLGALSLGWRKM